MEAWYLLIFCYRPQLVWCTNLHMLLQFFVLPMIDLVLLHQTTLDTMSEIVCFILSHNPPYILFPIASCNRHGLKANWIPISIQEMETLCLHKLHSSHRLTCRTNALCQLIVQIGWYKFTPIQSCSTSDDLIDYQNPFVREGWSIFSPKNSQ